MSKLRLSGLASGLDTDQIVSDLMRAERIPLDRLYQKKQLAEWKRDAYREITNLLRGFISDYFDILKPSSNMRSLSLYQKYTVTSSDSSVVTASAGAEVTSLSHTIIVNSLATPSSAISTGGVTKPLTGADVEWFEITGENNSFSITYNNITKTITLPNGIYADAAAVVGNGSDGLLKQLVSEAFPGVNVEVSGNAIQFTTPNPSDTITVTTNGSSGLLGNLGFVSGDSNKLNLYDTMEKVSSKLSAGAIAFDANGQFTLTINGVDVVINKTDTLSTMLNKINASNAGVTISYSSFTDKFTIVSRTTGEGSITLDDHGSGFLAAARLTSITEGQNASFILDGVAGSRTGNTFTIDGVTYTLLKAEPGVEKTVTLVQDVDATYNAIKSFVDKYNEIIDKINGKLSEKYDRNYLPLTQEQKEAMKEDEIKRWEEKAKTGLLRNDSILTKLIWDMRKALFDPISGVSESLHAIGISTGLYEEKGKLIINEAKLKEAIKNTPQAVMNVFAKESSIGYSPNLSAADKAVRYSENGIINRLYDILQDNVRVSRDSNGRKGFLLEKAGIAGDATEFVNLISKEISQYEKEIDELSVLLFEKQEKYYAKFTAMERMLAQMNAQSNWLMMQLGQQGQ